MRLLFVTICGLFYLSTTTAQNVGINTTGAVADASAMLDVSSTDKGMLIPRLTTAQRTGITAPATGLRVYDSSTNTFWYFNGTVWVEETTVIGDNGLTNNANEIDLGGALNQNTTIAQDDFGMTFNLDGTGDFNIQDNGINHFTVVDNGTIRFGGDVEWRDENTGGTVLMTAIDDGNDGRFTVRENGTISVDLDANTQFVFNEQGLDRNFRVESDGAANMLFVDAGNNRVGMNTGTPDNALDVNGKISVTTSAGNEMVIINDDVWQHSTGNQDFGDGGAHFIMASRETDNESAGIYGDGDHVTIWSPGDQAPGQPNALLYICDEDNYNNDGIPHDDGALDAYLNTAGNWVAASDRNRKTNIKPLENILDNLLKVNTYSYDFKLNQREIEKGDVAPHALGVIAQELEPIFPDLVEKSDAGDYYVSYTEFIPILIESIKEQQAKIDALVLENESLKDAYLELENLKQELDVIKLKLQ